MTTPRPPYQPPSPLSPPRQAALAPVLLRRMKEDVEDLPEKEEVVIWVEMTAQQRRCAREPAARVRARRVAGRAALLGAARHVGCPRRGRRGLRAPRPSPFVAC